MVDVLQNISDIFTECGQRYNVNKAYVFGSYARGEAERDSDVDICVEYGNGFDLFALGGLGKHLEDSLGIPVDIVCGENSFYPRAKTRYLEDRVLVYERC